MQACAPASAAARVAELEAAVQKDRRVIFASGLACGCDDCGLEDAAAGGGWGKVGGFARVGHGAGDPGFSNAVQIGLGSIVALYYRSSTLYPIHEHIRCRCF
jgi:hypothetical protein